MKRKAIMLAGTFAALLVTVGLYHIVTHSWKDEEPDRPNLPAGHPRPTAVQGRTDAGEGQDLHTITRDRHGRLEGVYGARRWTKRDDESYLLTDPDIELYQRGGQVITIRADEGTVYAEELAGGDWNIRKGSLRGNVRIFFDRSTKADRTPPEQRPGDVVRIFTDDLYFNSDLQEITTAGPVKLLSAEADIHGRGLLLRWNEVPRELRELRIEQGKTMLIYSMPSRANAVLLPGGASAGPGRAGAGASVPQTPASMPATQITGLDEDTPAEPPAKNVYRADFFAADGQDVRVDSGDRRVRGAERLSLVFEWQRSSRRSRRASSRPATAPAGDAETQPAEKPAGQPMRIRWSGPLVLKPIGHVAEPSDERWRVSAAGERVVLTDSQTTAVCGEFSFVSPGQVGELIGAGQKPAELNLAAGDRVTCRKIRFDRRTGMANLLGEGSIVRGAASGPEAEKTKADYIHWRDSVQVKFAGQTVRRNDGTERTRQVIEEAAFRGRVRLQQAATGDFVRCEHLQVWMADGASGRRYPHMAVATGDVLARQEGSDIRAGKVTVEFAERPGRAGSGDESMRVRAVSMLAEHDVVVTDRRDQDEPMHAVADRLSSDLIRREAVLLGAPARIKQGPNSLSGKRINLKEADESVSVRGGGVLRFNTGKDLNGAKLSRPRPVEIAFARRMDYNGRPGIAEFAGDVTLDSGNDHLECQAMRVWFEKLQADEPAPAAEKKRSRLVGMDRYSRRRVAMILAENRVKLRSHKEDEAGHLLRRLQLSGQHLTYDARLSELNVTGAGTLLVEDYRQPETRHGDSDQSTTNIERPSQTAFEWQKSLQLSQEKRLGVMEGDVVMVHRSGRKVVLTKRLNVRPWGEIGAGRETVLTCRRLMTKFGTPDARTSTQPVADAWQAGPRLGPLDLFTATEQVNLKDGPRQVLGQRLIYDRLRDLAIVWGFGQGRPPANANLYYEDAASERSQRWSSPKIIWYRRDNRIVTESVTGGGS